MISDFSNVPEQMLRSKADPIFTPQEAVKIILELEAAMSRTHGCVGLAAPQIAIPRAVAIVRHPGGFSLDLINPVVVKKENRFVNHAEGCMSYPGRLFDVGRYELVTIETDAIWCGHDAKPECCRSLSLVPPHAMLVRRTLAFSRRQDDEHGGGIVCVAVQHEIDHLNGIVLPFNPEADETTAAAPVSSAKVGRNDPCPCGSGRKFKRCCAR